MSTPRNLRAIPLAGNTATGALKLIALCFMMIDHMGKMLFPQVPEMRILGRIAFPLYAWCMVVGFHYTRNPWRYALRILLVGLVSQPLYMVALNHTWHEPNIFLTLFFALLALMAVEEKSWERDSLLLRVLGRGRRGGGLHPVPVCGHMVWLRLWLAMGSCWWYCCTPPGQAARHWPR